MVRAKRKLSRYTQDAADRIADAEKLGATQRETAKVTGKSVGWINALLQWRAGGFNRKPSRATNRKSDKPKSAEAFLKMTEHILADADVKLAKAPTPDVVDACRDVAEKWDDLAEKLDAMLADLYPSWCSRWQSSNCGTSLTPTSSAWDWM